MSKRSRVVTATGQDLQRIYGSERLLIGPPSLLSYLGPGRRRSALPGRRTG